MFLFMKLKKKVAPSARQTPRLIIRHHKPVSKWIIRSVMGIALVVTGIGLYYYGREQAGFDLLDLMGTRSELSQEIRKLDQDKEELRNQIAMHERTIQIERQAYHEISRTLKDLQDENLELKEEVAFYRGIVSPEEAAQGLHVQSFKLTPTGQRRVYRYKLVLTQIMKNDRIIAGGVDVTVEGIQDKLQKRYELSDLTKPSMPGLRFRFKYFQNIEGEIILPDGFLPGRVLLSVSPSTGASRSTINENFNWSDILN